MRLCGRAGLFPGRPILTLIQVLTGARVSADFWAGASLTFEAMILGLIVYALVYGIGSICIPRPPRSEAPHQEHQS